MNENDLARRIVAQLDSSLDELSESAVRHLRAARAAAVARHRAASGRSTAGGMVQAWGFGRGLAVRLALPMAIVIASLTGLIYWQMSSHHEEELDVGLLAGELPIHAYIDPGFDAWLEHTSYTQEQ